ARRRPLRGGDDVARLHGRRRAAAARSRAQTAAVGGTASREHREDAADGDILMQFFALTYDVVPGFGERRMPFRETHLRQVREAHERGLLLFAGALGTPPTGALLVFRADSPSPIEEFARADPYVREGLVTAWQVRPWTIVVGGEMAPPPRAL